MKKLSLLLVFVFVFSFTQWIHESYAQGTLWTGMVHENSVDDQGSPSVSFLGNSGDFVVVWLQSEDYQVYFRRFDSFGNPIDAVEVPIVDADTLGNGTAGGGIWGTDVFSLNNGDFIVVWLDERLSNDPSSMSNDIYAQYILSNGDLKGGNIRIDDGIIEADAEGPRLALYHSDSIPNKVTGAMVWVDVRKGDFDPWDLDSVFLRFFTFFHDQAYPLENAQFDPSVHVDDSEVQGRENCRDTQSDISISPDGTFVVSWVWQPAGGAPDSVEFSTFSEQGVLIADNILVASMPSIYYPTVSSLSDNGHVINWMAGVGGNKEIYAQRFNASDNPVDGVITVTQTNTPMTGGDISVFNITDDYIVTWNGGVGDNGDTYARILDKSGDYIQELDSFYWSEFVISSTPDHEKWPRIATHKDRFVTVWQTDEDPGHVFASLHSIDSYAPSIDSTTSYPEGALIYDDLSSYVIPIKTRVWEDSARINSGLDSKLVTYTRICPRPPTTSGEEPMTKIAGTDTFYYDLPEIEFPGTEIKYYIAVVDSALNQRKVPPSAPIVQKHLYVTNLGDININSIIDQGDLALLEDYVCFSGDLADHEKVFADFDQDSVLNCDDVDSLRLYAVADFDLDTLPSCLPDNGWFINRYPLELGVGGAQAGMSDLIPVYLENDSSYVKGAHIEFGYDGDLFTIVDTLLTARTQGYEVSPPCCNYQESPYPLAGIPLPEFDQYNLLGQDSIPPGSGAIMKLEISVEDSTPDGYYHFYITKDVLYGPDHKPVYTMPLRGKFFVPSPPPVSIVTTPVADTLLSPGDTLTFNTTLTNHSDSTKSPKFFVYGTTTGPDSFVFLAVDTSQILRLPPGGREELNHRS